MNGVALDDELKDVYRWAVTVGFGELRVRAAAGVSLQRTNARCSFRWLATPPTATAPVLLRASLCYVLHTHWVCSPSCCDRRLVPGAAIGASWRSNGRTLCRSRG